MKKIILFSIMLISSLCISAQSWTVSKISDNDVRLPIYLNQYTDSDFIFSFYNQQNGLYPNFCFVLNNDFQYAEKPNISFGVTLCNVSLYNEKNYCVDRNIYVELYVDKNNKKHAHSAINSQTIWHILNHLTREGCYLYIDINTERYVILSNQNIQL